jgi:predicted transcriptional regulator
LSSADAKIVKRLRAMELSQQRIADMMNVSRPLISMLLGGKLQYA